MTGQKGRIIRRFEREAKRKFEEMKTLGIEITCLCDKPKWHLISFSFDEVKKIINWNDNASSNGDELCNNCGLPKSNHHGRSYNPCNRFEKLDLNEMEKEE